MIPTYAMLDVWMALGGSPEAFDRMQDEPRRTPADTWAQLMAAVRGDDLSRDHNPPVGPRSDDLMPWSENDLWAKVRMRCIACGAVWTGIPSDTTCMNCDEDAGAEATDGR